MHPTLLAAIVGIIGVIVGALIGGIFVQRATKRQIEVMLLQSRGDVNERLYNQSLSIMKFFAENPELRPYFTTTKISSKLPTNWSGRRCLPRPRWSEVLWNWSRCRWRSNPRKFNLGGRPILSMRITPVPRCENILQPVQHGMRTT